MIFKMCTHDPWSNFVTYGASVRGFGLYSWQFRRLT